MEIETGIKASNHVSVTTHEGEPVVVRAVPEYREVGILAGEKAAIYVLVKDLDTLIGALQEARDKVLRG